MEFFLSYEFVDDITFMVTQNTYVEQKLVKCQLLFGGGGNKRVQDTWDFPATTRSQNNRKQNEKMGVEMRTGETLSSGGVTVSRGVQRQTYILPVCGFMLIIRRSIATTASQMHVQTSLSERRNTVKGQTSHVSI